MAQKIYPRSLRSQNLLSQDFSFYSEKGYASIWAKGYNLATHLYNFSQKNLIYKNKVKTGANKRPNKKKKITSFIKTRLYISNIMGTFKISPILFKFASRSLSNKYNPIKAFHKGRRLFQLKKFVQKNITTRYINAKNISKRG